MSSGPNMFGRPMPELRQRSMTPPANADAMYNAYPKEGMYVPQQGLFNNALMLGMRNPMQSLGYGKNPIASLPSAAFSGQVNRPPGSSQDADWAKIVGYNTANPMWPSYQEALINRYSGYQTAGGGLNEFDWWNQTNPTSSYITAPLVYDYSPDG